MTLTLVCGLHSRLYTFQKRDRFAEGLRALSSVTDFATCPATSGESCPSVRLSVHPGGRVRTSLRLCTSLDLLPWVRLLMPRPPGSSCRDHLAPMSRCDLREGKWACAQESLTPTLTPLD